MADPISAAIMIGMAVVSSQQQKQAVKAQGKARVALATAEANAAIETARRTRESAIEVLQDRLEQTEDVKRQKKSDAARQADRETAELVAFGAETNALGTNNFLNQMQQLQYFGQTDLSRIDRDARLVKEDIGNLKEQVVEDQRRVLNASSLQLYAANTDAKLANSLAKQRQFVQITSAVGGVAGDYYKSQALKTSAQNLNSPQAVYSFYNTTPTWR